MSVLFLTLIIFSRAVDKINVDPTPKTLQVRSSVLWAAKDRAGIKQSPIKRMFYSISGSFLSIFF